MKSAVRERFFALLRSTVADGGFRKLTLGKYRGKDASLRNLLVRPVVLKAGPHFAFVWRHKTRDVTRNLAQAAAIGQLESLVGSDFLDAHLFTSTQTVQLECRPEGTDRISVKSAREESTPESGSHDRQKAHLIPPGAPWLNALGVTNDQGQPRQGQAAKFRQINNFADLLGHLLAEAFPERNNGTSQLPPLVVADMGCGKGYLTFAIAALLGEGARVQGIEERPELVALCNEVAGRNGFAGRLAFTAGTISGTPLASNDVLVALHACDTATDDALAKGIAAGSRLIVVAPCCHKELRAQLTPPPVLAGALRHGIFQEREAEFATDALRALLLDWAGYRTKVFEFISTEHTAKNLMISAVKTREPGDATTAKAVRELAAFYGIRRQRLATHLGLDLAQPAS